MNGAIDMTSVTTGIRRSVAVLGLALTFTVLAGGHVTAEHAGDPVVGCPKSFALHHAHAAHEGHSHHHVGNDKDANGDGYICVKHVGKNGKNHVHIDNNVPVQ